MNTEDLAFKALEEVRGQIQALVNTKNAAVQQVEELDDLLARRTAVLGIAREGFANQIEFGIVPDRYASTNRDIIEQIDAVTREAK